MVSTAPASTVTSPVTICGLPEAFQIVSLAIEPLTFVLAHATGIDDRITNTTPKAAVKTCFVFLSMIFTLVFAGFLVNAFQEAMLELIFTRLARFP